MEDDVPPGDFEEKPKKNMNDSGNEFDLLAALEGRNDESRSSTFIKKSGVGDSQLDFNPVESDLLSG